ncbi:MAG: hypothetical protein Q7W30_05030 [Coriobacteriia bacterium]|nr:hypothetical protein [Coriobacteriia bacterium]
MIGEKRLMLVAAVVLPLAWVVSGIVNANGFLMGNPPTAVGTVAALVAACAWPVAGWFAGSRARAGFVRLATVFWIIVVPVPPLLLWALKAAPPATASQGSLVPVMVILLFALAAPLYGLTAALPAWEPLMQTVVIGGPAFAMTLVAYLARRRIEGRSAKADPV